MLGGVDALRDMLEVEDAAMVDDEDDDNRSTPASAPVASHARAAAAQHAPVATVPTAGSGSGRRPSAPLVSLGSSRQLGVPATWALGSTAEVRYFRGEEWYPATVVEFNSDGTYLVRYEDGDEEDGVVATNMRAAGGGSAPPPAAAVPAPAPAPPRFANADSPSLLAKSTSMYSMQYEEEGGGSDGDEGGGGHGAARVLAGMQDDTSVPADEVSEDGALCGRCDEVLA